MTTSWSRERVFGEFEDNDTIWRYMSLAKLLSMLTTKTLVYSSASAFSDQFEGTIPNANHVPRKHLVQQHVSQFGGTVTPDGLRFILPDSETEIDLFGTSDLAIQVHYRHIAYVSCWQRSPFESDALWKTNRAEVAIQTDIRSLRRVSPKDAHVGKVVYGDPNHDAIPDFDLLAPFFWKRHPYAYEQEIRSILFHYDAEATQGNDGRYPRTFAHDIDPQTLIHRIIVAPATPEYAVKAIDFLSKTLGFCFTVSRSALDDISKPLSNRL